MKEGVEIRIPYCFGHANYVDPETRECFRITNGFILEACENRRIASNEKGLIKLRDLLREEMQGGDETDQEEEAYYSRDTAGYRRLYSDLYTMLLRKAGGIEENYRFCDDGFLEILPVAAVDDANILAYDRAVPLHYLMAFNQEVLPPFEKVLEALREAAYTYRRKVGTVEPEIFVYGGTPSAAATGQEPPGVPAREEPVSGPDGTSWNEVKRFDKTLLDDESWERLVDLIPVLGG